MPKWESLIAPSHYLAQFPQEIPGHKAGWTSELLPDGARLVGLPNGLTVRMSGAAADLGVEEVNEFQTTMLWKHSLAILPIMIASGDAEGVESILAGYADFIRSERWFELSERMTSLDHCVASRIRAMCTLRATYSTLNMSLPDSALTILEQDLAWAGEGSHYASNNHGLMLGISTMHAAEVFPTFTPKDVAALAARMFDKVITEAFDETWVCVENTPEYQGFYLRLCTGTIAFLELASTADPTLVAGLHKLVDHATGTLSKMLLPSGHYPALGDSSGVAVPRIPSLDGTTYSPTTGMYFFKEDGVYFTFKCGYASYVHKHMDDTSVTLHVDGEDLILDAGFHNYDWYDPITRAVKSQRGHSGFFFPEFDHLYPATMYRPEKYRIRSRLTLLSTSRGEALLSGRSVIDDTHRVARLIKHVRGSLEIVDRYWVDSAVKDRDVPVQRFLVPESLAESAPRPGLLRYTGESSWLEFEFDPERAVTTSTGVEGELARGWVSRGWGNATPCRSIDIGVLERDSSARVTIRYGGHRESRHSAPSSTGAQPENSAGASTTLRTGLEDRSQGNEGKTTKGDLSAMFDATDAPTPQVVYSNAQIPERVMNWTQIRHDFIPVPYLDIPQLAPPASDVLILMRSRDLAAAAALIDEVLQTRGPEATVQLAVSSLPPDVGPELFKAQFGDVGVAEVMDLGEHLIFTLFRAPTKGDLPEALWTLTRSANWKIKRFGKSQEATPPRRWGRRRANASRLLPPTTEP